MGTNCYLAVDEATGSTAVIDPGDDFEKIRDAITAKNLKVEKIILTHAHFDHMLALSELRKYTGAPLLLHKGDAELLLDGEKNLTLWFLNQDIPQKPADVLLSDGDRVTVGRSTLTVMHTPGHTLGSMCLIGEDFIISGDTLFNGSIGRYDFPCGDYNTIMNSLKKLTELEFNYKIFPGHGASTHLDREKKTNIYLQ